MENTAASESADMYTFVAWAHKNRQRLINISAIVVGIAVVIGGYFWYVNNKEASANEALSKALQGKPGEPMALSAPEPYITISRDYSGTHAAARALIIAGTIQFEAGKFADAQATFNDFMVQYPNNGLANQAQVGVAASLEAQGKVKEATARYEDLVKRHQVDSTTPEAKSALARLYVAQNEPQLAFQQYEELLKMGNQDTWSAEAGIQLEELLTKHPELRKQLQPAPVQGASPSVPPLSLPQAQTPSQTPAK